MLSFFPRPYPMEWLYSVLCRYHVRTGNSKHQTTVSELFQGREHAAIGALYPNGTLRQICSQLSPDYLSVDELAIGHTLLPYFTKFSTEFKKQEALKRVRLGETVVVTSVRRFADLGSWVPRFCPECVKADRHRFGEAYWHIAHQISLMTVCPDHGCRLMTLPSVNACHLKYTFYPLDGQLVEDGEPVSWHNADWELLLSQILGDYQSLPFFLSPPPHNNLAITLANMGYGVIQNSSSNVILNAKRLYCDICDFFGKALVEQYFGGENSVWQLNRLAKWKLLTPERFALLQTFAGISTEIMFSEEPVRDVLQVRLEELSSTEQTIGRREMAKELGLSVSQIEILFQKYGMKAPWREHPKRVHKVSTVLTDMELAALHLAAEKVQITKSEFIRCCLLERLDVENKNGNKG